MTYSVRTVVKALTTAGLAGALVVSLAAPAGAGPMDDWQDGNTTGNQVEPMHQAPTANLTKLANALTLNSLSVSVALKAPTGLGLTNKVGIDVTAGTTLYRTYYNNQYGNAVRHHFPAGDGSVRYETVYTKLTEYKTRADGSIRTWVYEMRSSIRIEPLYNVSFGALSFYLLHDCDSIGESEISIDWGHSSKSQNDYTAGMHAGESIAIPEFSSQWTAVSRARSPKLALAAFHEEDPMEFYGQANLAGGSTTPVLPGGTRTVRWTATEQNKDCKGNFSYDIYVNLRTYRYI